MQDIYVFLQHHLMLSIAFLGVLLLVFIIEWMRLKLGARRLTPLETTQLINHQQAAIVDIRSSAAFNAGHIIGSISLPFQDLEKQYKQLEKYIKKPIIIICASGVESPQAANFLLKHQYNIYIHSGGIRAWKEADMPLIKG